MKLELMSKICVLFFLYIVVSYLFIGLTTVPHEGDSLNYHIPIAKAYLDGNIFHPDKIVGAQFLRYSPGAAEGVLAVLFFFRIPPNLYNVLGVVLLFFALKLLGERFGLNKNFNLVFASGITTLTGVVRWLDTQTIDIFLATFFVLSLYLLQKPEKKNSYFLLLGMSLGLLVGSKYSGLLFAAVLILVYSRKIIKYLNFSNIIAFLIPFSFLGLSWYLRNYMVTGNPFYPQGFLFFKDGGYTILDTQVWRVFLSSPFGFFGTLNAAISEYMILVLSVPIVLFIVIKSLVKKSLFKLSSEVLILTLVGILNLCIYFFLPSDYKDYIMVSVMRYSYSAFIPFILALFILAKKHKREEELVLIVLVSMFFTGFPQTFNPKLIFLFVPIALLYFYQIRRYKS